MIRVLHIVTYMGRGGLETMLMNYYRHVDREKIQFDFLVHRDFKADYDDEICAMGGQIYRVSRLVPWSAAYRRELKAFFRSHPEYQIVHVHQDCLSAVALKCAKECGVPVRIAHSHNSSQDKNWKLIVKKHYMKQIPAYATHLFACSKAAGDWMFQGKSYSVLCNAIDIEQYRYMPDTSRQVRQEFQVEAGYLIGHVGRFNAQKNHDYLIDVFSECVKLDDTAYLLLVGDGDGREKAEQKICILGLQDRVIFAGVRSDVPRLMQGMDVFVFPSLYEGLPVTMIEAQAAGLPCVISDRVPREVEISDGLITFRSLEESPEAWARCILQQAQRKRENHTEEVRAAGYDIQTAAKKLERFYLQHSGE